MSRRPLFGTALAIAAALVAAWFFVYLSSSSAEALNVAQPTLPASLSHVAATPIERRAPLPGDADSSVMPVTTLNPSPHFEAKELTALLWDYRADRRNVFFDREAFLEDGLARDPDLPEHLTAYLSEVLPLSTFSKTERSPNERREVFLERMAAVDLLEQLALGGSESAKAGLHDAFAQLMRLNQDGSSAQRTRNAALADNYDILASLTRIDLSDGVAAWRQLEPRTRAILRPAVVGGLVDRGMSRDAINDLVLR